MARKRLNFYSSQKFSFFVQRGLCLSPFSKKGNQLISTTFNKIYVIVWLSSYIGILTTSFILLYKAGVFSSSSGSFLWAIIIGFEIVFSISSYIVMIIYVSWKKQKHIAFLHKLYHIDFLLEHEHKFLINYSGVFWRSITSLVVCIGYFNFWFYLTNETVAVSLGYYLFIAMYYLEQYTCSILATGYFNVVLLIKDRFIYIKSIQKSITKNMGSSSQEESKYIHNVSMLMLTFKELCDSIDMLNEDMGQIFILRYGHDLTLTVSHMFMIFSAVVENNEYTVTTITLVVVWMLPNVVKMILPAVASRLAVQEVFDLVFKD